MIDTLYKPFRHWSYAGPIYILSDLHFGDADCKLMDENWISEEEQVYIINHCKGIEHSTFVCLGDVGKKNMSKKFEQEGKS